MDDDQQRQIAEHLDALKRLGYTEEELDESRQRMLRMISNPIHKAIADQRAQNGSGP
jgi:hypothetical protein